MVICITLIVFFTEVFWGPWGPQVVESATNGKPGRERGGFHAGFQYPALGESPREDCPDDEGHGHEPYAQVFLLSGAVFVLFPGDHNLLGQDVGSQSWELPWSGDGLCCW